MLHILTEVCTSGKKHENLHKGGFGYADVKNRGKRDGIPTVPAQNWKLKMAATKTHFPDKSAQSTPIKKILVSNSMFLRSRNPIDHM